MEDSSAELKKYISRFHTAFFMSKAILEDYAERMSKLDGTKPEEIKQRVNELTQKYFDESKKST